MAIAVFLLFVATGGVIVRELWNWLLPPIFGIREITFVQALGILLLSRILVGGFGLHGSSRTSRTPEERERIRQAMRRRLGFSRANEEERR
jgi:hypothetical protein